MRKRLSLIVCCLLLFGLRAVSAQASGKIQGTVTDQAGAGVAKAQVILVGTAFGAVTDDKGYYFINNVPPGTYTLRGQFIGFAPTDLTGVHVLGGQTLTENVTMKPSAVVVGGINVVAAANPIVPRDEVTSKSIVSGQTIASLPISDVRSVLALQPGVVESGNGNGVSIRGGRPGEANVYIDGAPVRTGASAGMSSALGVQVQTNAVEEASVTTGALPVQFGDAQSGVIQLTTRAGGERLQGSLSAQSDGAISSASQGLNRFEGTLGGPVPGLQGLRFYVSGVLSGQTECSTNLNQTCAGLASGAADVPNYTMSGIDTTVQFADANGVQTVAIPRFVQYGGQCDASQNAGFDCHGAFRPMDWGTAVDLQGKLSYSYGSGSSVALSALAGGFQNRNWPGTDIGDPARYAGSHSWSRTYTLNWSHQLFKSSDRALAFNVVASYGTNNQMSGPLDPTSEADTRNPLGGIELSTLHFGGFGSFADEFFNDPDQIVKNLRTNSGLRIPLQGRTDLSAVQPYRENPYAMASGNWYTAGLGNSAGNPTLYSEKRLYGTANVDWQANRYHRFTFGGEIKQNNVAAWQGGFINQIFMNAYHDKPVNGAAWAADRLDLGDVVIDLGVRWDYFNSEALFPNIPAFIFNNPSCSATVTTQCWDHSLNSNSPDAAYQAALDKVMTPGVSHTTLSPRIGVSFPITDQTDFHLSYSHQVQSPDLATLLGGINTDLTNSNANDAFGRDVGFGKTILFEFGVRHAFNPDFVVDVAAYNKSKQSDLSFRIFAYDDPTNPGRQLSLNTLTDADFGYDRGLDMKIDRRLGNWLQATLAYTYEVAAGTGSNPNSYLNTNARSTSGITGQVIPPAEQARAINDQRTHNIAGALSLTVPQGWHQGSTIGSIFKNVSAFATFRFLSGLPYTPLINAGAGNTAPGTNFGLSSAQAGDINSASTPWVKYLDLRINKGLRVGRVNVTAFADVRNLLNFKNVLGLFAETNDVTNAVFESRTIQNEFVTLANEASNNGALNANGSVSLANCGSWTAGVGQVVDCVELSRAEKRFGNGDGTYTVAEQTAALNSFYQLFNGPYTFNDLPRQVRLGFELSF